MFQEGLEQEEPHESGFLVQSRVSVEKVHFPLNCQNDADACNTNVYPQVLKTPHPPFAKRWGAQFDIWTSKPPEILNDGSTPQRRKKGCSVSRGCGNARDIAPWTGLWFPGTRRP